MYCNASLTVRVTVDTSLTLRVTIDTSFTLRVTVDDVVAVGHAMVTRCVSEEAAV